MADAATLKSEGNEAFKAQRFEEAVGKFTQALGIEPENHVFFSNRSAALVRGPAPVGGGSADHGRGPRGRAALARAGAPGPLARALAATGGPRRLCMPGPVSAGRAALGPPRRPWSSSLAICNPLTSSPTPLTPARPSRRA